MWDNHGMENVRVGSRVRVDTTGRVGTVVVDYGTGYYAIALDDGWTDAATREGLTAV